MPVGVWPGGWAEGPLGGCRFGAWLGAGATILPGDRPAPCFGASAGAFPEA